jgi:hypothetical protein
VPHIARSTRKKEKALHRSISVTALAAFITLGTQSAFAGVPNPDAAATAAPAVSDGTVRAASGGQRVTPAASISGTRSVRVRRAARIPGTFAVSETPSENELREEQFRLRVLFPALSGDGGG